MTKSAPQIRLFVPDALTQQAGIVLSPPQSHYLATVMRARAGDAVALFNGRDGEWQARLDAPHRKACGLTVETRLRPQTPEPDLWLLFAPIKGARLDFVVEKATELGVSVLQPVLTRHTIVNRVNAERVGATLVEAAEQCERLSVPELRELAELDRVLAAWPAGRPLIHLDETGAGRPIAEVVAGLPAGPLAVLVGPEGGFAKAELDHLAGSGFAVGAGLGPRILRADTAAVAALACVQALAGDWRLPPAFRSGSADPQSL